MPPLKMLLSIRKTSKEDPPGLVGAIGSQTGDSSSKGSWASEMFPLDYISSGLKQLEKPLALLG